jgi:hypothetical protein
MKRRWRGKGIRKVLLSRSWRIADKRAGVRWAWWPLGFAGTRSLHAARTPSPVGLTPAESELGNGKALPRGQNKGCWHEYLPAAPNGCLSSDAQNGIEASPEDCRWDMSQGSQGLVFMGKQICGRKSGAKTRPTGHWS